MNNTKNNKERDIALVNMAISGDQKAYSELMTLYWASVEKTFSLKLQSREDVEDLSIATFSKAFDKLNTYNSDYAFSTWISTIATNTLIDFFRKKQQNTISIDDEKEEVATTLDLIDNGLDPERNLIQKQKNKQIASLVHQLKPHYRELIIMRYLDELTYAEIADQLNMPLGSVKAKLFRARDLLVQILKPQENEF